MFTIDQIKAAHSKVKSGADFPAYIQDLKKLGVASYEAFVEDGHTEYFGANEFKITSPANYEVLKISDSSNAAQFISDLKAHQSGKTDYPTFCNDAAKSGIEKWAVDTEKMTCIYFDKLDNEILIEVIPHLILLASDSVL